MRKWLNNYLELSKGEFNGLMVLICCIIAATVFPSFYRWLRPATIEPANLAKALQQLEQMPQATVEKWKGSDAQPQLSENVTHAQASELFTFNPNTTGLQDWKRLGFSEKQARSIMKYVDKGGKFRESADLKRLYVVSPEVYERLAPYVRIPTVHKQEKSLRQTFEKPLVSYKRVEKRAVMVDVNRADSLALLQVRGIGPAFARRILKYRDRVGGFYRKEQLMEVFGLDSVKFAEIKDQVLVDVSGVKPLNINTASFEDFKNHPYLRYKQINAIIQYRAQHGNYGNFEDLKKVAILSPDVLERLAPYISF